MVESKDAAEKEGVSKTAMGISETMTTNLENNTLSTIDYQSLVSMRYGRLCDR